MNVSCLDELAKRAMKTGSFDEDKVIFLSAITNRP